MSIHRFFIALENYAALFLSLMPLKRNVDPKYADTPPFIPSIGLAVIECRIGEHSVHRLPLLSACMREFAECRIIEKLVPRLCQLFEYVFVSRASVPRRNREIPGKERFKHGVASNVTSFVSV